MLKSTLIVEDNESDLYLAQISLRNSNVAEEIHTAKNGQEALSFLLQFTEGKPSKGVTPPELIFVDLIMPVMDGFELMEAFRPLSRLDVFRNTRVVVCTYSDSIDDKRRALSFPFVKYFFRKPFSPLKVKEAIKALEQSRRQS